MTAAHAAQYCAFPNCTVPPTKNCSRCEETQYCSKEHQTAHWNWHKQICVAPQHRIALSPAQYCAFPGCTVPPTNTCSRCLETRYCPKEHQKNHWKDHKQICANQKIDVANPHVQVIDIKKVGTKWSEWYGVTLSDGTHWIEGLHVQRLPPAPAPRLTAAMQKGMQASQQNDSNDDSDESSSQSFLGFRNFGYHPASGRSASRRSASGRSASGRSASGRSAYGLGIEEGGVGEGIGGGG
ncbi:hypothetical protein TL16_g12998 [Triparma laevis f. inornata]|uniref:MYND-type domain-containing protein n=1 Tax=Triparma laevis f. inornata TaxID=1714386 RepID=A0A9W7EY75_9STRA|nr:hypothetical protein TL16_g12998 [Triparma laevis f. inornata]